MNKKKIQKSENPKIRKPENQKFKKKLIIFFVSTILISFFRTTRPSDTQGMNSWPLPFRFWFPTPGPESHRPGVRPV